MKVTRDVIYDLLPGYFAAELSDDAKALVEEFFASDPEFARMAERFRRLFNERREASDTAAGREKALFEWVRSVKTTRDRIYGIAVGCTLGVLLVLFLAALFPADPVLAPGFGFMRVGPAAILTVLGAVAVVAWIAWFISRARRFTWSSVNES